MKEIINKVIFGLVTQFARLPFKVLYVLSDIMAFVIYRIVPYRKKTVFDNLRTSFPEKSEEEIEKIARQFYINVCDVMVETLKSLKMNAEEGKKRFRFINPDILYAGRDGGPHNKIAMIGHYANWEWLTFAPLSFPDANYWALYQPIENPYVNEKVKQARRLFGVQLIESHNSLRVLSKLDPEQNNIVLTVADQSPTPLGIKHWVNFLNHETPAYTGSHQIAEKYNYDVFYYAIRRLRRGFYETEIKTLHRAGEELGGFEIIDRYYAELEKQIGEDPASWLWSHRRFKHTKENLADENSRSNT